MKTPATRTLAGVGILLAGVAFLGLGCDKKGDASLSLPNGETYAPAEMITVAYAAPAAYENTAWIGMVLSETPHGDGDAIDRVDIDFQYLNGSTSGSFTFRAPLETGEYDFRLVSAENGGTEDASVSFKVEGEVVGADIEPTITLDKDTYRVGEEIRATFTAPSTFDPSAWIGVVPSETGHAGTMVEGTLLDYDYLGGDTSGTRILEVPKDAGEYDVRIVDNSTEGKEVAIKTFTVVKE